MANELVLIVEDNENNRKLARELLRIHGYATIETGSAEEGIRLAREHQPALILLDFHLPRMNGIQALRELRAQPETRAIPAIAVTASAMTAERAQMIEAGFEAVQTKPIDIVEFVKVVAATIGRSQGSSA
jgi:two-component system, cell cycle response regulator DivK